MIRQLKAKGINKMIQVTEINKSKHLN